MSESYGSRFDAKADRKHAPPATEASEGFPRTFEWVGSPPSEQITFHHASEIVTCDDHQRWTLEGVLVCPFWRELPREPEPEYTCGECRDTGIAGGAAIEPVGGQCAACTPAEVPSTPGDRAAAAITDTLAAIAGSEVKEADHSFYCPVCGGTFFGRSGKNLENACCHDEFGVSCHWCGKWSDRHTKPNDTLRVLMLQIRNTLHQYRKEAARASISSGVHEDHIADLTAELAATREKLAGEEQRGDLHADLNRRTAEALGKPTSGDGSSWHDIPERVKELREALHAESNEADGIHDKLTRTRAERDALAEKLAAAETENAAMRTALGVQPGDKVVPESARHGTILVDSAGGHRSRISPTTREAIELQRELAEAREHAKRLEGQLGESRNEQVRLCKWRDELKAALASATARAEKLVRVLGEVELGLSGYICPKPTT